MRLSLLVVGRPRQGGLADAIADYEKRAARYWPLDVIEIRDEPAKALTPSQVMEREAGRIAERLPESSRIIACDPHGDAMTSGQFSQFIQGFRERSVNVAFVIGGAFGLGETIRSRAASKLSLASWTLPHELARLVLAEQLYRAGTIQRGEPYHK